MIVRQFLLWAREAAPGDRAEAVAALCNAYLYSRLSVDDHREARTALTAMLDDGSTLVRLAMAEVLGGSPDAPHHLVVALAGDAAEIAAIVLSRSPVLSDRDLIEAVALGEEPLQCAIAVRPWLSPAVSAALCEIGGLAAVTALAGNPGAEIDDAGLARALERHGGDALLREALLGRPGLPVEIAQMIAAALALSLGAFVTGCGWLSPERSGRATAEAKDRATVALAARAGREGAGRFAGHLRRSGQLTPTLLLRAMLSGNLGLAAAAFADLSGMGDRRVSAILRDGRSAAFRSLYDRAGLPAPLIGVFEAARAAVLDAAGDPAEPGGGLMRRTIERALAACGRMAAEDGERCAALLRRFEAEAARDEARIAAGDLADRAAYALISERSPELLRLAVLGPEPGGRLAA